MGAQGIGGGGGVAEWVHVCALLNCLYGKICDKNEIGDEFHYLFICPVFQEDCNSGVARGGRGANCPRAPPGGGRQNPAKEFLKFYILRIF